MAQAIADIAEQRKALGIISSVVVAVGSSATKAAGGDSSAARVGGAGDSDAESDAEVATMPRAETDAAMADASAGAPFDEDGPNWPSAADEAAFIGGEKGEGRAVPKAGVQTLRQEAEQAEAVLGPLPSLDALIARIPTHARETLEDLFRPKFTGVKRVSKEALK